MKLLIIIFCLLISAGIKAQEDFYDLSLTTSSGKVVNLVDYKGKKLLIVTVEPIALQSKAAARYLGDIQASFPGVSVLILPTSDKQDSLTSADTKILPELDKTVYGSTIENRDDSGFVQHPLLRWLTKSTSNKHFDKAITPDEKYFVINESGVLYAVLDKSVSDSFLKVVLNATEVKYLEDTTASKEELTGNNQ